MWDNKERNYFIYAHYREDSGEIFYVGIGRKHKGRLHSQIYQRAYQCSSSSRNYLWIRCYTKHGRTVRILYDNLTEKESKEKEIYLISKFGRIIDRTGILCNISGGGEGRFRDRSNNKKVYVYNLQGTLINTFPSCLDAAEYYGIDRRSISMAANMKRITAGNMQFRYEYNKGMDLRNLNNTTRKVSKPIACTNIETGQELTFTSTYKFQHFLGLSSNAHIIDCLNGKRNSVKGWRIKYSV